MSTRSASRHTLAKDDRTSIAGFSHLPNNVVGETADALPPTGDTNNRGRRDQGQTRQRLVSLDWSRTRPWRVADERWEVEDQTLRMGTLALARDELGTGTTGR